jgi:oxygen-dependent protoporphyrinogen oxidase
MSRPIIAVIGGGIAGLVAARALAAECDVSLFEAGPELGGKLETRELNGAPVDIGPDAFITRNDAGVNLCEDLGLGNELLPPSSNSVAIFSRGELRRLPTGIVLGIPTDRRALRAADIVSRVATWRVLVDTLALWPRVRHGALERAKAGRDDPTVAEVFGARLGQEVLHTLIDPLLGGINASDVDALSLAACAPQLLHRLEGGRSVMRSLRSEPATFSPASSRPPFIGLTHGMGSLVSALIASCRERAVALHLESEVASLERDGDGKWKLITGNSTHVADAVLIATPAFAGAKLLANIEPGLARELATIPYASVVTACFSWPAAAIPTEVATRLQHVVPSAPTSGYPLVGSGVLVPRDGKRLLTAATFTSSKWPRSAATGEVVIRAFAGRHSDDRALGLGDEELEATLLADLGAVLGIASSPTASLLHRWKDALPQYVTGHLAKIGRIEAALSASPTLGLAGAAYHGIGIPSCIENGQASAERLLGSVLN